MRTADEFRGAVARVRAARRQAKRATVSHSRAETRQRLSHVSTTPVNRLTRVENCDVGTRFEVLGAPQCNGTLLYVSEGSASVVLCTGARVTIALSTVVRTLPRVEDQPTRVGGASLPYRGVGLALWLLQRGWSKADTRRLLDHYGVKLSDSSLRILQGKMADRYSPADVTAEHAAEFEALR